MFVDVVGGLGLEVIACFGHFYDVIWIVIRWGGLSLCFFKILRFNINDKDASFYVLAHHASCWAFISYFLTNFYWYLEMKS